MRRIAPRPNWTISGAKWDCRQCGGEYCDELVVRSCGLRGQANRRDIQDHIPIVIRGLQHHVLVLLPDHELLQHFQGLRLSDKPLMSGI